MDELKDQDLIEFDSNFIEKLRKNDKATQERCYVLLSPEIYTLLVKICRDRCAANDLLHDTFIKVFDVAESIDNSVNLRAWIKRIAINKALNYLKRNKYLVFEEISDNILSFQRSDESNSAFEQILSSIPPEQRVVMWLFIIEEYTHKEISQFLSKSESYSKSIVSRCLSKLRTKFGELYESHK